MKKIGIIGGLSAYSTIEYYRILVEEYNKIKGKNHSPELIIESLDLEIVSELMKANKWVQVADILIESAQNLILAGAEIIIMATNTPHKVYPEIAKHVPFPFPSIMDATAEAIVAKGISKVGLLGTRFTMQGKFYLETLAKYSIEILVPSPEDQEVINNVIWKELARHELNEESKMKYLEIINKLVEEGAEGIILGCTEIPLLIKQEDCPVPVFNTTAIHAKAALKLALVEDDQ